MIHRFILIAMLLNVPIVALSASLFGDRYSQRSDLGHSPSANANHESLGGVCEGKDITKCVGERDFDFFVSNGNDLPSINLPLPIPKGEMEYNGVKVVVKQSPEGTDSSTNANSDIRSQDLNSAHHNHMHSKDESQDSDLDSNARSWFVQ